MSSEIGKRQGQKSGCKARLACICDRLFHRRGLAKLEQRRGQGVKIDYAAILERARKRVESGEVPKPRLR